MYIGGIHWRQIKVSREQSIFSLVCVGERIGLVECWGGKSILFRSKPLINGRPVSTTDHDQSEYRRSQAGDEEAAFLMNTWLFGKKGVYRHTVANRRRTLTRTLPSVGVTNDFRTSEASEGCFDPSASPRRCYLHGLGLPATYLLNLRDLALPTNR